MQPLTSQRTKEKEKEKGKEAKAKEQVQKVILPKEKEKGRKEKVMERKEKDMGREMERKAKEKAMANTTPSNLAERAEAVQKAKLLTRTVNQLVVGPHQATRMLVSADFTNRENAPTERLAPIGTPLFAKSFKKEPVPSAAGVCICTPKAQLLLSLPKQKLRLTQSPKLKRKPKQPPK